MCYDVLYLSAWTSQSGLLRITTITTRSKMLNAGVSIRYLIIGPSSRKNLREMDRDKQSSKHTFGALSDPTNKFVDGWMASHRVILVQLPDDSSLAGNGNSNCSSRFSSSSFLLVLALRLTAVSGASLAQLSYAAHAATPAVRPNF